MDRFTTDLFDKMTQVVNEAIAVGDEASETAAQSTHLSEVVGGLLSSEKFGKFFQHENQELSAPAFEEIDLLRGNVNRLEVLHAKLQYMMVELESLAKRA